MRWLWVPLSLLAFELQAQPEVTLTPSRDTVLFENDFAELSSGVGPHLFGGRLLTGERRRSLIAFDLSSIPAGATVLDARLTLYLSRTLSGPVTVSLHRALGTWGEAGSDSGFGGAGATAQLGDATWRFRMFDQQLWATEGGDFIPVASAQTLVSSLIGPYDWADAQMAADVQRWLDDPAQNHGWILIGAENSGNQTAMRFESRENFALTRRPMLTVTYQTVPTGPPPPPPPLPPATVPTLGLPALGILAALMLFFGIRGAYRGRRYR